MQALQKAAAALDDAGIDYEDRPYPGDGSYERLVIPSLHSAGIGQVTANPNFQEEPMIMLVVKEHIDAIVGQSSYIGVCQRAPYQGTFRDFSQGRLNVDHTAVMVNPDYRKQGIGDALYDMHVKLNGERDIEPVPICNDLVPFFMKRGFAPMRDFHMGTPDKKRKFNEQERMVFAAMVGAGENADVNRCFTVELEKSELASRYYEMYLRMRQQMSENPLLAQVMRQMRR